VERLVAHLLAASSGHGTRSAAPEARSSRVD
jgi:hypothetical protein